jgi:hypothetical protein
MDIIKFSVVPNVQIHSSCVASFSYVVSIEFTSFSSSYLLSRKYKKYI